MRFQPWERDRAIAERLAHENPGRLELGMKAAIDLLRAEAKRAEADALAFGQGELANGSWLRHVATKMSANFLQLRLHEITEANKAVGTAEPEKGKSNANQT